MLYNTRVVIGQLRVSSHNVEVENNLLPMYYMLQGPVPTCLALMDLAVIIYILLYGGS